MIRLLRDYPYPFLVALLVICLVNSCLANILISDGSDGPFHPAAYSSGADGGTGYARLEAADTFIDGTVDAILILVDRCQIDFSDIILSL